MDSAAKDIVRRWRGLPHVLAAAGPAVTACPPGRCPSPPAAPLCCLNSLPHFHGPAAEQEPFLAIVVDPHRTVAAGKVEIGAFRTFPEVRWCGV